jgi:outer membrane protein insertion porin family
VRRFSAGILTALALLGTGCKDEGMIAVHSLTFTGVHAVSESRLRDVLATRPSSWMPFGHKHYFDREQLDADLKRIGAFYADQGYPRARVTGVKVHLDNAGDAVDITVAVAEGEPVILRTVRFSGFDVLPPDDLQRVRRRMPLTLGRPRERQAVITTHEMALDALRDDGYAYARVAVSEQDGPDGSQAVITFAAEPGPLCTFGPVEVVGNRTVGDNVIKRQLSYKPGDRYGRSLVQRSQRRLYSLDLFQFATVNPVETEAKNPVVATRVTVAEAKHHRVNFGVGYGTEEKARVDGEYHNLNFLGGARTAGVHARWSSLDRGVRADFNQPFFFSRQWSLGAEAQQWYTYTPAYRDIVTGVRATLIRRLGALSSVSASFTSEYDSSAISNDVLTDLTLRNDLIALGLDPRTGRQEGQLNAIALDFQRMTADNILNPQHGYQLALHAEDAGRILPGTFSYFGISVDARHYMPLGGRVIWANRLQAGSISPARDLSGNVPFSKLFFLGGATSLRGWGRYEVSPLSGSGLPIGGESMLAFATEARVRLGDKLGAVAFFDAGNVWSTAWTIRPSDLRYDIGPGIRYMTPVGPLRFDFGYQLNPIPGLLVNGQPEQRRWRIHFSIGQAF